MEILKQGQRVAYDINGSISGYGKVVGKVNDSSFATYIIEPEQQILNDIYPYSHFVCLGVFLTKI